MRTLYRRLSFALCLALVLAATPLRSGVWLFQSAGTHTNDYSGQGTPYTSDELQQLVAPIALYPDPLVAQVLSAATYPDQIAVASEYLQREKSLAGNSLMQVITKKPWDPSVKALSEFALVLNNMSQNLAWASQLGEAYHNQQNDVMAAIQALRAKALAAGNLKPTAQIRVQQPTPDIIGLQPANPQVVYIPLYNPELVYGTRIQTDGYSSPGMPTTSAIEFGPAVAIGALTAGGCCDWGSTNWNCNWYHGVAYYHDLPYAGNNAWQGSYYGGYIRYGNHSYHTKYDYTHPYIAFQKVNNPRAISAAAPGSTEATSVDRLVLFGVKAPSSDEGETPYPFNVASGGWEGTDEIRGWAHGDSGEAATAFSTWGHRPAASGFGRAGWGDRSASFRGWTTHGGNGGGWGTGGRLEGNH